MVDAWYQSIALDDAMAQRKQPYGNTMVQNEPRALGGLWRTTNRDYLDAHLREVDSNTTIMIASITDSMQWPIREALPVKLHTGSTLRVKWNEWAFNDSYVLCNPEESVSGYMSNPGRAFSASLFCWAHSIKMERGHFFTQEARASSETSGSSSATRSSAAHATRPCSHCCPRSRPTTPSTGESG